MSCKECELLSQLVSLVSYRNINNSHAQLPGEALQSSEYQVAAAWVPVDAVHGLREMGIPMGPWVHGGMGAWAPCPSIHFFSPSFAAATHGSVRSPVEALGSGRLVFLAGRHT